MKRIIAFILAFCMTFASFVALTSCELNFDKDNNSTQGDNNIGNDDEINNDDVENKPDDSGNKPDDSGNKPDDGGNKPDDGENKPDDSGNKPDDSGNKPDDGENKPNDGENKPDDGENNPDEGGNTPDNKDPVCTSHVDSNNNDYCDICNTYVVVVLDFYVFNDLHGKFCDTDTQPGVDEIGTYFEMMEKQDDNIIILSSGDMWQGSAESTLTNGKILVDWMNALGFVAMTLGNHEFDWGEDAIRNNLLLSDFPFLAINIYDKTTGELADYCTPSIMLERDGIQIGIIGAIGDCYSSISSDMVENVTFKVGSELTNLVKAEATRLRSLGADIIVYSLHDGEGSTSYYDTSLSNGYVDIVFEAHTHQDYVTVDSYGVYHLQGGGENYGFSHVEISVNSANGNKKVTESGIITTSAYKNLEDHQPTEEIEDKYSDLIDYAYADLGVVSMGYSDSQIEDFVAQLYLEAGLEKWGSKYNIVLGGGFLRTRIPYNLTAGVKKYADILSLFPFNNRLVLCTVSGSNLKSKFINSTSSDYHIALSDYGQSLTISNNSKYYIIVDTYTALYAPNGLTIVEYFEDGIYARDLLADAIQSGRLEVSHDGYTLTSIKDALTIGNKLTSGKETSESYYIKGTVKSISSTTYGNLYIADENGNQIYIYGLYDNSGNRYDSMSYKPKVGDTIIVYSTIYKYNSTVELKNATVIEINP